MEGLVRCPGSREKQNAPARSNSRRATEPESRAAPAAICEQVRGQHGEMEMAAVHGGRRRDRRRPGGEGRGNAREVHRSATVVAGRRLRDTAARLRGAAAMAAVTTRRAIALADEWGVREAVVHFLCVAIRACLGTIFIRWHFGGDDCWHLAMVLVVAATITTLFYEACGGGRGHADERCWGGRRPDVTMGGGGAGDGNTRHKTRRRRAGGAHEPSRSECPCDLVIECADSRTDQAGGQPDAVQETLRGGPGGNNRAGAVRIRSESPRDRSGVAESAPEITNAILETRRGGPPGDSEQPAQKCNEPEDSREQETQAPGEICESEEARRTSRRGTGAVATDPEA